MDNNAKACLACMVVLVALLIAAAAREFDALEHRLRVLAYSVWGLNFEDAYEAEFQKQLEEELQKRRQP